MKSKNSKNSKRSFIFVIILLIALGFISVFGIKSGDKYLVAPLYTKVNQGLDLKGGVYVVYEAETDATGEELSKIIKQTIEVFRKRIDGMGLTEPLIIKEGTNRIRVELPGVKDVNSAIQAIGKTAQLKFFDKDGVEILNGSNIKDSAVANDNKGQYVVTLQFNDEGTKLFADATAKAAPTHAPIYIMLDDKIISAPSVQTAISGGTAEISGNFTAKSASELASLIRAGALPVNFKEIESSTKSAQLGDEALMKSLQGAGIGILLVMLYMAIFYKIPGILADIALGFYIIIFLFLYTLLGATLTLPGIAALILSVGMAVDANVIIFERIKEELEESHGIKTSIKNGFSKAFSTIMDSQITTIIAGIVLYAFGTGSVRGFAVTLILGIMVSLFTAIVVTKFLYTHLVNFVDIKDYSLLGVPKVKKDSNTGFSFIKNTKAFFIVSLLVIVIGLGFGVGKGFNLGIDFSGGTLIEMNMHKFIPTEEIMPLVHEVDPSASIDYLGDDKSRIQIKTTKNLDEGQRKDVFSKFQKKYTLQPNDLVQSGYFGASVGQEIQRNAVISIIIASICMLIYITFRFKLNFGIAAIISLLHDVFVLLAVYALFRVPVNSPFVAAVLTVVGYSINDTIVVFDRIRENLKGFRKMSNEEVADLSIRQTLTRSINTSITTLLSIVCLYLLGVDSIKEFTLPLLVGIASGTYSSICIASPLWVMFEKMRDKKNADKKNLSGKNVKAIQK
ncbi:protein translocase subunit SecDF [Criibacterium bergeronii]|uniref:Multifunctional fusion protein n=1 Tax=Criibacterium bergeronii TaxID=1871336 RepID=A0A371IMW5_9FIRM|nr:protein translocase subunit SecDF [Criibacterium bergeronii]RDY21827.1 protein translocase subunit SecDF [Criibacterium bergeronii]